MSNPSVYRKLLNQAYAHLGMGLILGILFMPSILNAQVNLRLIQYPNRINILLVPETHFQGVVSNVQFSLKWVGDKAILGPIKQAPKESFYIPMEYAGEGIYREEVGYQKIAGFGLVRMPLAWEAIDEVLLMEIPIIEGNPIFEIVDSQLEFLENESFYVELNGHNASGKILENLLITELDGTSRQSFSVYPNPFTNQVSIRSEQGLHNTPIAIYNILGTRIFERTSPGVNTLTISTNHLPKGIYVLKIGDGKEGISYKIVKTN